MSKCQCLLLLSYLQKLQVFWWSPTQGPTWVSGGIIHQTEYDVQVETQGGTQAYRLFDHVTVVIQLKKTSSNLHKNELSFHLLSKRRSSTSKNESTASFGKSEINFLQELKISQERNIGAKEVDSDEDEDEVLFNVGTKMMTTRKKKTKSVYKFFREMNTLGSSIPQWMWKSVPNPVKTIYARKICNFVAITTLESQFTSEKYL